MKIEEHNTNVNVKINRVKHRYSIVYPCNLVYVKQY